MPKQCYPPIEFKQKKKEKDVYRFPGIHVYPEIVSKYLRFPQGDLDFKDEVNGIYQVSYRIFCWSFSVRVKYVVFTER